MKKRPLVLLTLFLLLLMPLVGACRPAATEAPTEEVAAPTQVEEPSKPTEAPTQAPPTEESVVERPMITIRLHTQDMQQLDPALVNRAGDWWIANNIYSGLVRWETGTPDIRPDLAESWEFSVDGKEVTFHLREGVMWHKGYGEVTAEDVKFSFDRILDPETGSPYNETMSIIDEVVVLDKYTVKLIMESPSPSLFTSVLPFRPGYIIPKKAVEEMGQADFALNPIGSGPFIFDHWTPGVEVVLLANDEYYEGSPRIAGLRMLPIVDESAVTIAMQTGEILFAYITTSEAYQILAEDPDIEVVGSPGTAGRYLWLNSRKPPTNDVRVRQALWYATDREAISMFGFDGIHPALDTILPPTLLCYTDDVALYDYNPEKAKELLEEAGYSDGFTLTLLYSQRPQSQIIAEMIQDQWKQIGVTLEITGLEHGTYTSIRKDPEHREDYDIIQTMFGRNTDPHSFLIETLHSSAFPPGSNASYYDVIDELMDEAVIEVDQEKRCDLYRQIQEQIQNDAPAIPIQHSAMLYAYNKKLKGVIPGTNLEFFAYSFYLGD